MKEQFPGTVPEQLPEQLAMCLAIPVKIFSIKDKKITVEEAGQKKSVSGSLIKAKVGDYVILQNNFIVRKIDKKAAKEIVNLIKR